MSEQNGALMRRWFEEVWNHGREDAIDEMMADDIVASGLTAEPIRSRDAFKQFYRPFIAAFPDIHVSVEDVFTDGDRVAFRCHLVATHLNGRRVEFDGGGFTRITDGMIRQGHNVWNFHEMLAQLGAITPDAVLETAVSGGPAPSAAAT